MAKGFKLELGKDGIATVYMTNGENRVRMDFVSGWHEILDEIDRDTSIKGLIAIGQDKYFSLGLDLEHFQSQTAEYVEETRLLISKLYRRLMLLPIPTVAAVNGHAYGAGAFLALAFDYRVMRSDRGYLCWPEVNLGMRMQPLNFSILRSKIPTGKPFRDAILFGKALTAKEAYSMQIVDIVSERDQLEMNAKTLIKEALGKRGIDRKALGDMKKDVFALPDMSDVIAKL